MNAGAMRGGRGSIRGGGNGGRGSGYASNNPSQSAGSEYGYAMGSVFNNQQNPMSYLTLMAGGRGGAGVAGQGGPYNGARANSQGPMGQAEGGLYHGGGVQGAGRSGSGDYANGKEEGGVDGTAGSYNGSVNGSARLGGTSTHGVGAVERRGSNASQMGAGGGRGNAIAQVRPSRAGITFRDLHFSWGGRSTTVEV